MDEPSSDYDKPVAYDVEGQPLYSHPPIDNSQLDNTTPPIDDKKTAISDVARLKHNRSKKTFPNLSLNEGDYVISLVSRHPIGLLVPFAMGLFLVLISFFLMFNYDSIAKAFQLTSNMANSSVISSMIIIFIGLVVVGEYVAYYVFTNNKLYITNENVIQEVQTSPFSKAEHTVILENIDVASYIQNGIMQQMFNYGLIQLGTRGDKDPYLFTYAANPKEHIEILNNAIENFKNRRLPS